MKVWDAETGQEKLTLKGHTGVVNSVAWSSDGKRIASGSGDSTLKVWDAETGQEIRTFKGGAIASIQAFAVKQRGWRGEKPGICRAQQRGDDESVAVGYSTSVIRSQKPHRTLP